jgi:hypothetical protein
MDNFNIEVRVDTKKEMMHDFFSSAKTKFETFSPSSLTTTSIANDVLCPIIIKIGTQTLPMASLIVGEASLSYFLGYGVILPSPIGIELMEFPTKMMYVLSNNKKRIKIFSVQALKAPITYRKAICDFLADGLALIMYWKK